MDRNRNEPIRTAPHGAFEMKTPTYLFQPIDALHGQEALVYHVGANRLCRVSFHELNGTVTFPAQSAPFPDDETLQGIANECAIAWSTWFENRHGACTTGYDWGAPLVVQRPDYTIHTINTRFTMVDDHGHAWAVDPNTPPHITFTPLETPTNS